MLNLNNNIENRIDVTDLTEAITVLERPSQYSIEQKQQAQSYIDKFKIENASWLHMLFLTYYEFKDTQYQHKFWTLTAINDVLSAAV